VQVSYKDPNHEEPAQRDVDLTVGDQLAFGDHLCAWNHELITLKWVDHVKRVVFRYMWVRGAKRVDHAKIITWKSCDFTSVIDLEQRLTKYPTLHGFDKFIHSIERFTTSVPLIEKAQ
jgi:hypothetical protein